MTNIQTQAAKFGKMSKGLTQTFIKELYNKSTNEDEKGDLAMLYAYFMPAIPKKSKDLFNWVYKASCKPSERRPTLDNVYSDGEYLYGSDGHVIHYIKTDLPEGRYNQLKEKIETDCDYAYIKRFLFAGESKKYKIDMKDAEIKGENKEDMCCTFKLEDRYIRLNKNYLETILNGETQANIEIFKENEDLIFFEFEDRKALMMCMGIK